MMSRALKEAVTDLKRNGKHGYGEVKDEGGLDPDTGQGVASSHWHQGAAAAEVDVDEETGKFRVVRLHAPIYAGRVVNRPAAELQNEGSMIMGLGSAFFESNEFAEGQITNANFSDYNVPAMDDMPSVLSHELIEREGGQLQGLGETALPPVPPAIGNALHSLGIDVREVPITTEKVLDAVDARDGRDEAPASARVQTLSANGHETTGSEPRENAGEKVFAPGPVPEASANGVTGKVKQTIPTGAKELLTSTSSLLFFGTLGAGLLVVLLIRLLGRNGEEGQREVTCLFEKLRRS
jgi:hypothetical protein